MRVPARAFATRFPLQISLGQALDMCRETSRVSFLMCPFCVRALMPFKATRLQVARTDISRRPARWSRSHAAETVL